MIGPDPYSFAELWRQYRRCRRGKRNTINALRFEVDAEANLLALQKELREHTYRPGRSVCFVTDGPKPREVFAAGFRDRVVHHLLVSWQEPLFERRFIHDSYACREGKGTLAASDRLMDLLRKVTANGRRPAWALKLDVASFFASIHKETLYEILARACRHPEVRWLTRTILFHDPTRDYVFRTRGPGAARAAGRPGEPGYPVPDRKSLFGKENQRGLPIGNLTSQFWGNVYLNELDHFVKRRLRVKSYVRYVDDLVLLSPDRSELAEWRVQIEGFLAERLHLALRAGTHEPEPAGRGADFVGWRTFRSHRLPRHSTIGRLRRTVHEWASAARSPSRPSNATVLELRSAGKASMEGLRSRLAPYAGHLCHGASRRDWTTVWSSEPWLAALFSRDETWRPVPRWSSVRLARAPTFAA
ncbi:MAG: RNA-directed DNA polymerase [Deltaproteobacteria bacterium]|nr:RNA-directed DNA polymerase [Deltaproteobacteria bacterium]